MIDKQINDEKEDGGEGESEFDDLASGVQMSKGDLEQQLDSQAGNLEKELGQ